jgi:hypothetical protein
VILLLRKRHRRMFAALGVLLPLLFVVGIAMRRAVPQPDAIPHELTQQTVAFTALGYARGDLFENSQIQVRLWREQGTGSVAASFGAPKDFLKPDLLAYWSAARPADANTLPGEARLLGAFVAGPLTLPPEASLADGFLILFSLANQQIVDVSKPTRFSDSMK